MRMEQTNQKVHQFRITNQKKYNAICDVSGMIGCYTHGNGNDRFIPYLYVEAGAPYKTQKMVRYIMDRYYVQKRPRSPAQQR